MVKLASLYNITLSGYWETLLHQLKGYMARARLREFHQVMLRKKLDELKKQVRMVNTLQYVT